MELDDKDTKFINRLIRRKIYFLIFSISSTLIGIALLIYHIINKDFNGPRFVLIVFILLSGRQNLRQYRISQLLTKVKPLIFINKQE
ncbi:MAG: hypothetical protein HQK88_04475 [Nitrospirae bacterium]|nr:hypothetical protein [Nitrospirota bacterium]MBF0533416.1 hypothetical protein [Nitrospirota bacterium]MBF0616058.1 hypothetical protein [Nitrospirota bacterium]